MEFTSWKEKESLSHPWATSFPESSWAGIIQLISEKGQEISFIAAQKVPDLDLHLQHFCRPAG